MYTLGGYIRKYGLLDKVKTKLLLMTVIMINFWYIVTYYTETTNNVLSGAACQTIPFYELYHLTPIIMAVVLFELFKRIPAFYSKTINYIGSATLMIYLVHDNDFFYSLWNSQDWISLLYYSPIKFVWKYSMWGMDVVLIGVVIYTCCSKIINGTSNKLSDKDNKQKLV